MTDFALLCESAPANCVLPADLSVQCGAFIDKNNNDTIEDDGTDAAANFTVYITMANRGTAGDVRVEYLGKTGALSDVVIYPIAALETVNITMAAGGTLDADSLIKVSGANGALLVGQISMSVDGALGPEPHPGNNTSFCTTTLGSL